jgi:hypothetical protein
MRISVNIAVFDILETKQEQVEQQKHFFGAQTGIES